MAMLPLEQIKARIEKEVPGAHVEIVPNPSVPAQSSLVIDNGHALAAAEFLRNDREHRFDYASNVTGVDWLDATTKVKVKIMVDGAEKEIEESVTNPGYLEAVYHLYSMEQKHGPLVVRLRTENRSDKVHVPSLTPVWRGAELQEREIYDLYGIIFDGHPDLRRLLMWEGFADHPMRKDYVAPDDYEYEPTPHDDVLVKAKAYHEKEAQS